jgi:hypothetical protein
MARDAAATSSAIAATTLAVASARQDVERAKVVMMLSPELAERSPFGLRWREDLPARAFIPARRTRIDRARSQLCVATECLIATV